ncbi:probable cytochrome P450 6a14 [Diaphorina citri]|uniref:Probable cytochrome P450 6a14 n=1 Tax=Diaphorina citri TaxID=121845 RepID=A0A1S3DIK0_DIACI|nr:probable cytochrome P450 6a14 [Diaphorina citri]
MRRPPHIVFHDIYMEIKFGLKSPFAGIYTMTTPVLVLTESEIIKHVLIKDFDVFTDRGFFESDEPVLKILFGLTGDEWRKMRNKLSPTFTSGKIKEMFPLMETCGRNLETILTTLDYNKKHQSIDVKEYLGRYMTDVIGSTVFGLEINSLENPDCEFRRISKEMFTENNNMRLQIILALILLIPYLRKFMSYMMLLRKAAYFFLDVVHQNVSYREQNNIKRNDFINIMMELKKTDPDITEELITAQCFLFFFAGFDTSSTVLTFSLYELAKNKSIQSKLRNEINDTKAKYGGELTYESYNEMPLLDKVIKESLRMYTPLSQLERVAGRPYQLPNTDIVVDKGTKMFIPLYGLHHDPEIYPNPDVFDPERFAPENADNIPNYAYLPFGEGPRNCIGKRFALLQLKSGLAHSLSNFEWDSDHTNVLRFLTGDVALRPLKPIKLKVRPISYQD